MLFYLAYCQLAVLLHLTMKHTLSPAQRNKSKNLLVALGGLKAFEVVRGFLEVVDAGCLYKGAIGLPFPISSHPLVAKLH